MLFRLLLGELSAFSHEDTADWVQYDYVLFARITYNYKT